MRPVTNEMQKAEERAFKNGLDPREAMFNAGKCVFERAKRFSDILIVAGAGNNGGDGFVCADLLKKAGKNVTVVLIGDVSRLSDHAKYFFDKISISKTFPQNPDCVIDALFGIGFHGTLEGAFLEGAKKINSYRGKSHIIAVDVPSGLNAVTGETEYSVIADETVTFGAYKTGQLIGKGADVCGRLTLCDIDIPVESDTFYIEKDDIHLPDIPRTAHKGTMGHVGVIAASFGMEGAGALCAISALRTSAGKVSLCVPQECTGFYSGRAPEVMLCVRDDIKKFIADKDAVVFGPGIGRDAASKELLEEIISVCRCPLIIDADGLYYASAEILRRAKCPVAVTPHMGEASRLFGVSIKELSCKPTEYASCFARESGAAVLLKSNYNVISDGKTNLISAFGCAGMATAGSGDTLAGILAGAILLQKNVLEGIKLASYIHGTAGRIAEEKHTAYAMTASDISENIGAAFKTSEHSATV